MQKLLHSSNMFLLSNMQHHYATLLSSKVNFPVMITKRWQGYNGQQHKWYGWVSFTHGIVKYNRSYRKFWPTQWLYVPVRLITSASKAAETWQVAKSHPPSSQIETGAQFWAWVKNELWAGVRGESNCYSEIHVSFIIRLRSLIIQINGTFQILCSFSVWIDFEAFFFATFPREKLPVKTRSQQQRKLRRVRQVGAPMC